jgi:hypothetical protein
LIANIDIGGRGNSGFSEIFGKEEIRKYKSN